jgi:hypothetical protein
MAGDAKLRPSLVYAVLGGQFIVVPEDVGEFRVEEHRAAYKAESWAQLLTMLPHIDADALCETLEIDEEEFDIDEPVDLEGLSQARDPFPRMLTHDMRDWFASAGLQTLFDAAAVTEYNGLGQEIVEIPEDAAENVLRGIRDAGRSIREDVALIKRANGGDDT